MLKSRRSVLAALAAALGLGAVTIAAPMLAGSPAVAGEVVEVWASPYCGCCAGWVQHMEDAGFAVRVHDVDDVDAIKQARGVPMTLASCHTATVGGYVVEGHVPAADVERLLAEMPQAGGLAVPGMPQDAPGMDGRTGQPYEVVLFGIEDGDQVFARH